MKRQLPYQSGITTDGKPVIAGIFRFTETTRLPLADILSGIESRKAVPDWIALYDEMRSADPNRKEDRILSTIEAAIKDALYEAEFCETVMNRLKEKAKGGGDAATS